MPLQYCAIASVDGYVADVHGRFDWAAPDEEVHAFVNDLQRDCAGMLLGRRMYEVLSVWETDPSLAAHSPITRDYAELWQAADKHVYSATLDAAVTARTTIHRTFDADAVRELTANGAWWVGGPTLAGVAFATGLITEVQLILVPVVVGGGLPALPVDGPHALRLIDERRFGNGTVSLRYSTQTG